MSCRSLTEGTSRGGWSWSRDLQVCEVTMIQLCSASVDNIRLWNAAEAGESGDGNVKGRGGVQFKIIPGHHGGYVSQMGKWAKPDRAGGLSWNYFKL